MPASVRCMREDNVKMDLKVTGCGIDSTVPGYGSEAEHTSCLTR
jgi:hypothetical protein